MTPTHPRTAFAIALPLRRLTLVVLAVAALLLAPGEIALARQASGPLSDVIGQAQMSPADLQAIRAYTEPRVRNLADSEATVRSTARRELMAPFMGASSPSVSFRIAYGDELMGVLRRLAGGADESSAVGALRLAGLLGTTQAEQLLAQGMGDERAAVRFAAASAYGELLRAMAMNAAAIPANQHQALFQKIGAAMEAEANILVVDAFLRAFNQTSANDAMRVQAMEIAMDALSSQLQRRRGELDDDWLQAAQTALRGVAMAQQMIIDLGAGIPRGAALSAARLTGQAMAFAQHAVNGLGGLQAMAGEDADTLNALLRASETTAALSNTAAGGPNIPDGQPMDRAINQGNADALNRAVDFWIGQGGVLTRAPHIGRPADFQ